MRVYPPIFFCPPKWLHLTKRLKTRQKGRECSIIKDDMFWRFGPIVPRSLVCHPTSHLYCLHFLEKSPKWVIFSRRCSSPCELSTKHPLWERLHPTSCPLVVHIQWTWRGNESIEMSKKWVNVRIAGGCLEYVFFALFAKSMFDSAGGEREK